MTVRVAIADDPLVGKTARTLEHLVAKHPAHRFSLARPPARRWRKAQSSCSWGMVRRVNLVRRAVPHATARLDFEQHGHAAVDFGSRVRYCPTPYEALEGADAAVIVTEWDEVRNFPFDEAGRVMKTAVLVDGRNVLDPDEARRAKNSSRSLNRVCANAMYCALISRCGAVSPAQRPPMCRVVVL